MSPFLICLASTATVWIATIVMSESAAPGRRGARLYVLRFVIVPLTAVLPVLFLLAATGRAAMSTLIVLAALVGLAIANHAKARTLREPVVFFDYAHLVQVATNPAMYIPFVGVWRVTGLASAALTACLAALLMEPPLWAGDQSALPWARAGVLTGSAVMICAWGALVRSYCRFGRLDRLDLSTEPYKALARLGLIGSWLVQFANGRNEMELERIRSYRLALHTVMGSGEDAPHMILVQGESFFDIRRLFACAREDSPVALVNFDRACATGLLSGPLEVSAWGANTLRTEFAVLSMIPESELGIHRFNPYLYVAREPVWTLARHLRSLGYRTICVHPFSKRFFGRGRVYGNLGFDEFIDIDAFADAVRCGPYVCDRAIAEMVGKIITTRADDRPIFVFAITMEAHGPWLKGARSGKLLPHLPTLPAALASYGLARLLYHLKHTDRMIGDLMELAARLERNAVLGVYGDHLPILPETYEQAGFHETATDYVVWRSDRLSGRRKTTALAPEQLGREVLAAAELIGPEQKMSDRGVLRPLE